MSVDRPYHFRSQLTHHRKTLTATHLDMNDNNNSQPDDLFVTQEQYDAIWALLEPAGDVDMTPSQSPNKVPITSPAMTTTGYFDASYESPTLSLPSKFNSDTLDGSFAEEAHFTNRGLFSHEQKALIGHYCNEPPSVVLERLQQQDPSMTQTRRQVKGAVENERRKQRRREPNGPWTQEEVDVVRQNLDRRPRDVMELLRSSVTGFRKNVDQVRDVKNQLVARAKDRQRGGTKTTDNNYVE